MSFPATAFLDSAAYMEEKETTETIGFYGDIILGRRTNDVFEVLLLNIFKHGRTYRQNHCFTMFPCTV